MYDAIISTFGNLGDEDMALETFYSRSQETDESILELSLSLCGLWDKVGNGKGRDKALKARLTGAVNDKGLGQELRRLQLEQPLLRGSRTGGGRVVQEIGSQIVECDSGKVCCMGLIEGVEGDSVVINPGLNQVEGGKVWVDISNYSDKEVVIKAGKRIAILTTGVTVVKEDEGDVERCVEMAMTAMDTSRMSKEQTAQVRELVTRHSRVFSSG